MGEEVPFEGDVIQEFCVAGLETRSYSLSWKGRFLLRTLILTIQSILPSVE